MFKYSDRKVFNVLNILGGLYMTLQIQLRANFGHRLHGIVRRFLLQNYGILYFNEMSTLVERPLLLSHGFKRPN